ncbi:MAG: nuclear transport factor 2 family protein, partial [Verrucomicrobia bacterium]|nr:nuclear transport factor 2 family protein [Verrucomicrobiota bacterium]
MKLLLFFLCLAAPLCAFSDDAASLQALRSADDLRVEAMRSPEAGKLDAILSDALRYAHSNGAVDSKASLTELLLSGKSKYLNIDYQERNFSFPAPGIALMTGRANVK